MEEKYLENVLKQLKENQLLMKNKLNDAFFNSTNEEEKSQILGMINMNDKIETAIANKDLTMLQKIYSDANIN
jgi:hypothetical protein